MSISIREIAQIAGVSASTVSMVLNNKKGVNPETRDRINRILDEKEYSLEKAHSKRKSIEEVCILRYMPLTSTSIEDQSFVLSVIENLYDGCYKQKLRPKVTICDETNYIDILQRAIADGIDAIIVLCFDMDAEAFNRIADIDGGDTKIEFIGNGRRDVKSNTINLSNNEDSYMAVKYLYDCGYRSIGYLHSALNIRCFKKREYGFMSAVRDLGMECALVLSMESQIADAEAFITQWLKKKIPIPRAFFADNDNIALGAMRAFTTAGYRIPQDISIIGMDDIVYNVFSAVPLTTIHISRRDIAKAALAMLQWNITDSSVHLVCRGRIVLRESTRLFDPETESATVLCS